MGVAAERIAQSVADVKRPAQGRQLWLAAFFLDHLD